MSYIQKPYIRHSLKNNKMKTPEQSPNQIEALFIFEVSSVYFYVVFPCISQEVTAIPSFVLIISLFLNNFIIYTYP